MDEWLSHRSAKPSTAVRIRFGPQKTLLQALVEGFSVFYTHFHTHFYALTPILPKVRVPLSAQKDYVILLQSVWKPHKKKRSPTNFFFYAEKGSTAPQRKTKRRLLLKISHPIYSLPLSKGGWREYQYRCGHRTKKEQSNELLFFVPHPARLSNFYRRLLENP